MTSLAGTKPEQSLASVLLCQDCGRELSEESTESVKCSCGWAVKSREGVFSLGGDPDYYFGSHREETRRWVGSVRPEGGGMELTALNEGFSIGDYETYYATSWRRADVLEWIDLQGKTVLDFGSGWGTYSIPAAHRARLVVAVDRTVERLRVLSVRARRENLTNLISVQGDATKLRLKDESFDSALLIGFLEWVPDLQGIEPRAAQIHFLRSVFRGLKNRGTVLLGIENRLNPFYFVGHTDHGEIPFTPLLPRPVANFVSRIAGRKRFVHYLYSHAGYRKLLLEAGFVNIRFVYPLPTYKRTVFLTTSLNPRVMGQFLSLYRQHPSEFVHLLQAYSLRAAISLRIAPFVVPSYYVMGSKQ